jgi:hypothetical protein
MQMQITCLFPNIEKYTQAKFCRAIGYNKTEQSPTVI